MSDDRTGGKRVGGTPWDRIRSQLDGDEQLDAELTRMVVESSLPAGAVVVRAQSSDWLPTGVPGVRCKILAGPGSGRSDGKDGEEPSRRVLLMSVDAGAVYPGHEHPDVEETFVLSGDLRVGDLCLGPGDFQSLPGGSFHPPQTSEAGCLCLVICSPHQKR
ncbi:ChrR Cupin-like domain protein [Planctomycetes bacterium Poly30]|uniref:ChrR Cupin-like domain protein n=1 Tax=Saltatorellus ferox TaxID=2528018 RepID=A0A518EM50_9BACT|nr:ChrR Cupin-like domain protein [Planctomycetes bacterium Poly30]